MKLNDLQQQHANAIKASTAESAALKTRIEELEKYVFRNHFTSRV